MLKSLVFSGVCLALFLQCDLWNRPLTRSEEEYEELLRIRSIYVSELPSHNVFTEDDSERPKTAEEWAAEEFGLVVYAVDGFDKAYPIEAGEHYIAAEGNPEYDDQAKLTKITVTLQLAVNPQITTSFDITLYPAEEKYYKITPFTDEWGNRVIAYPSMVSASRIDADDAEVELYVYPVADYTIKSGYPRLLADPSSSSPPPPYLLT